MRVARAVLAAGALLCAVGCSHSASSQPDIVVFMTDDAGYNSINALGNRAAITPHLDALVQDSVVLSRHYSFHACAPSRSSFFTGRLPHHVNEANPSLATSHKASTLDERMETLPQMLKRGGYSTHLVGKYHLGDGTPARLPTRRGFDSFLGLIGGSADHLTFKLSGRLDMWRDEHPVYHELEGQSFRSHFLTGEALRVISGRDEDTPMFLMFSSTLPHGPLQMPQEYLDKFAGVKDEERRVGLAMVAAIDDAVGAIVNELRCRGTWENTLFLVLNDNGGDGHTSNYPLRGEKRSVFEGGMRSHAIVGGGLVPTGQRGLILDDPVHICDWFRTLRLLAGVSSKGDGGDVPKQDSEDLWPFIAGAKFKPRNNMLLAASHHLVPGATSIVLLSGNYKLIIGYAGVSRWHSPDGTSHPEAEPDFACDPACLFDLRKDPSERKELAGKKKHANRVQRLTKIALRLAKEKFESPIKPDEGSLTARAFSKKHYCACGKPCSLGPWVGVDPDALITKCPSNSRIPSVGTGTTCFQPPTAATTEGVTSTTE